MTNLATRHVWFDGRLVPADVPQLSVYDRGFQIGDGVFEALRAVRGVAIELEGHLARLQDSLDALEYELPFSDEEVANGIAELLRAEAMDGAGDLERAGAGSGAATPMGNAVIRITTSRGFDPTRGIAPTVGPHASVVIQAWPFSPPSERALREGESVVTSAIRRDPASPMAGVKTISRADLVYARIEASRAGADDAVFLTTDGRLAEATTSNLLVVRGDTCTTPRLGCGLLAGTTRAWLVAHGDEAGLQMVQGDIRAEDVFEADEMAVCSSIAGVVPVTTFDGRKIGSGRPGHRILALREVREHWIDETSREVAAARLAGAAGEPER